MRNVVAVLPGTDSTGRLYLMAHHDSVETGPGGNDDAAGVSTLLESVRALTAGPQLRNDVVVVLTDAEEACLCGAEAFAASHPLAAGGGVVLNFEARGTTGPPIMFETSRGNAGLAGVFAEAAPHPVATQLRRRGLPGAAQRHRLQRAARRRRLHRPEHGLHRRRRGVPHPAGPCRSAWTGRACRRSATTRWRWSASSATATSRPLAEPGAEDATYFPVLDQLVRYPGSLVWPLAARRCWPSPSWRWWLRRRGDQPAAPDAGGTALALLPLVVGPLAAQGLWLALVADPPGLRVDARPVAARLVPAGRGGARRRGRAALVRAAAPPDRRRRRWPSAGSSGWPSSACVLAGVRARAARTSPRGRRSPAPWPAIVAAADGRPGCVRAVARAGRRRGRRRRPGSDRRRCSSRRSGCPPAPAPAFVAALLGVALLPAFELLFPDADAAPTAGSRVTAARRAGRRPGHGGGLHRRGPARSTASTRSTRCPASWSTRWTPTPVRPGGRARRPIRARTRPATSTVAGTLPVDFPYLTGQEVATGPAQVADLPAPSVADVTEREAGDLRESRVQRDAAAPGRPAAHRRRHACATAR